jgi:protein-L-isoaspartate(D-aspartate) O-methyltransferase
LQNPAIRRAFLTVPRESFVPEIAEREGLERVYEDQAIVTAKDERGIPTSSSSQPSLMASMLEQLDLRPGQRVLEVGAGSGYNAALLSKIVGAGGRVVSVELDPATAREARRGLASVKSGAKVVAADGREGLPRGAPYDRIIVTASATAVARAWHDQLAEGGLLELPLSMRRAGQAQAIVTLQKEEDKLRSRALLCGGFMPLREAPGGPVPAPPPSLSATERIDDRSHPLAHLSGEGLRRLSAAKRQRLLSLSLSEPRTRALGLRAPRADLALYLTIEAPEDRFLGGWARVGVVSENGDGLALLGGGKKTLTRIESYGEGDAERLLVELVEGWKQRGRPTGHDLAVEVSFRGRAGSKVRLSWSTELGPAGPFGLEPCPS